MKKTFEEAAELFRENEKLSDRSRRQREQTNFYRGLALLAEGLHKLERKFSRDRTGSSNAAPRPVPSEPPAPKARPGADCHHDAKPLTLMIRSFEPPQMLEPESDFQWSAVWGAGFIAGLVLLLAPRGSPWSGLTFLAPVIMGRVVPPESGMSLFSTYLVHMGLAMLYGLIVSWVITSVTRLWAIVVGGFTGLILYLINLGVVSTWFPQLRGNELPVLFAHVAFGLIAGGAYRGLLRRKPASVPANP